MAERLPGAITHAPGRRAFFVNKWRSDNLLFRHPDPVIAELVAFVEDWRDAV